MKKLFSDNIDAQMSIMKPYCLSDKLSEFKVQNIEKENQVYSAKKQNCTATTRK